jgi:UDPglucose 6-dehydrogenase
MNIGIIGVGKLGLAYALVLESKGYNVFASSYKQDYVEKLNAKKTDSKEPGIADLLINSKNIDFTVDNHKIIDQCDFIYVMVATPSTPNGDYDVSAVIDVAQDLLDHPSDVSGKILVIGSTVNPGTCDTVRRMLADRGVHVAYSPTFVAQGSVLANLIDPHTVSVGTENLAVADTCKKVFGSIIVEGTPIYVMKPLTAEILKLAGNCRSTMDISYFNMIGQILLSQSLEQDLETACQYLNFVKKTTKWKFGFGYGGPCYPRDNQAMVHYANSVGMDFPLGKLVDKFNTDHVLWLTEYVISKNKNNLPFYFPYISYKPGVNIIEESHQLQVCLNLLKKGKTVYVELSKFLLPETQDSLIKEFTNQVKFVKINDLNKEDVYTISF